jgi:hypothetical protein
MTRRLRMTTLLSTVLICALIPAVVSGQAPPSPTNSAGSASSTPRTPWGDPDFAGVWSSDDMRGIPRERPDEFGTRRLLTDEEYAKRVERDTQTRTQESNRVGAFRNDVGTRTFRQTSLVVDPPDGKIPALTAAGQSRARARNRGSFGDGPFNSPGDFTLYDRCITRGVVGSLGPAIYGNGVTIVQSPGMVAISYEMVHDTRLIPLDGRPHLASTMRQYMGSARGRWEGETLVIETTGFTDKTAISGLRHSTALRLTERISRVDDLTLDYQVTIDDPETYTKPWTMVLQLTHPPGFQMFAYECHEGNLGLRNILSAERAEDTALADDLKKGIIRPRRPPQGGDSEN